MKIWDILGIGETKDKEKIQAAYRTRLTITNPEDDPQGFMELRKALEEAMKAADQTEKTEPQEAVFSQDPVGQWMKKADQLYRCFSRRIDPMQWRLLLQDPVCLNLDTRIQVRTALMEYIMEHFFLPQSVVCELDHQLGLAENMEELKEQFPENFLDIVIMDSIRNKEYPPYEYLQGEDDLPFDEYLELSSKLRRCIGERDTREAERVMEAMESTGIQSPFLVMDRARVCCQKEEITKAMKLVEALLPQYDMLDEVHLMKGDIAFLLEDYTAAEQQYRMVLKKDPDSDWGRCGLAKCLITKGEYKDANEILCRLLEEDPYDTVASDWLEECNRLYIEELKERIRRDYNPEDLMQLAWCYFQNQQPTETMEVLSHIDGNDTYDIEYYSLMGQCCIREGKSREGLEYLEKWENMLRQLPDDEEGRTRKEHQLPYALLLESLALQEIGDYAAALELVEQLLDHDLYRADALRHKGHILYDMWDFAGAADVLSSAIEAEPENHTTYLLRAKAFYRMDYLSQAYDDCEKSLDLYPFELETYVYKTKILIEANEPEAAEDTLQSLEKEEVSGSEMDFLRGYIQEAQEHFEEAERIYKKILSRHGKKQPDTFDMENTAEVWHHLAVMSYDPREEDCEPVLEMIEKGLTEDPSYVPLLEMKADILEECGCYTQAILICKKILKLAPAKTGIYGQMDQIYRGTQDWDKALEYAQLQLQQTPGGYAYMRRGQIYAAMDRTVEAGRDFEKAIELSPELSYPYNYMGVLREYDGREEEALNLYEKAILTGEQEDDLCDEAYRNAANLYCRKKAFEKACEILRRAWEHTEDPRFLCDEIEVLRLAGSFGRAGEVLKEYRKAAGIRRLSFDYNWELAQILRDSGRLEEAFDIFDAESVNEPAAGREAAKILYYKGKYKKALKILKKAILMLDDEGRKLEEPEFTAAEYYLWAARTAMAMDDKKEAWALAQAGLDIIPAGFETELESQLAMVYKLLGGLYTMCGNFPDAQEYLQEAMDVKKCDYCNYTFCVDAMYEMGYLYQQQGREEEARACYREGFSEAPYDADLSCAVKLLEKRTR